MNLDHVDAELYKTDWTSISSDVKKEIIEYRLHYTSLSKRASEASGAYLANFRTLSTLLLVSLGMSLWGIENRIILLTFASFQLIKTLLCKLLEASMHAALDIARQDFSTFLKRKLRI